MGGIVGYSVNPQDNSEIPYECFKWRGHPVGWKCSVVYKLKGISQFHWPQVFLHIKTNTHIYNTPIETFEVARL